MRLLVSAEKGFNTLTVSFKDMAIKSRYRRVVIELHGDVLELRRYNDVIAVKSANRTVFVKDLLISAENVYEDHHNLELHVNAEYVF